MTTVPEELCQDTNDLVVRMRTVYKDNPLEAMTVLAAALGGIVGHLGFQDCDIHPKPCAKCAILRLHTAHRISIEAALEIIAKRMEVER